MKFMPQLDAKRIARLARLAGRWLTVVGLALIVIPMALQLFYYDKLAAQDGAFAIHSCTPTGQSAVDYACDGVFRAADSATDTTDAASHHLRLISLNGKPEPDASFGATYYKNYTLRQTGQSPVSFGKLYGLGTVLLVAGLSCVVYYRTTGRYKLSMVHGSTGHIISK